MLYQITDGPDFAELQETETRFNMSISAKQFKKKTYELLAVIGKALSSPIRLELLDVLSQGPRTVESLSHEVGQSIANTSQHLQVLRSGRLIEAEHERRPLHIFGVNRAYAHTKCVCTARDLRADAAKAHD